MLGFLSKLRPDPNFFPQQLNCFRIQEGIQCFLKRDFHLLIQVILQFSLIDFGQSPFSILFLLSIRNFPWMAFKFN